MRAVKQLFHHPLKFYMRFYSSYIFHPSSFNYLSIVPHILQIDMPFT